MKPCRAFQRSIALFALDHLSPTEADRLSHHLHECPQCQAYLRELRLLQKEFTSTEPPEEFQENFEFADRLFAAIQHQPQKPDRPSIFLPAALAACLAILIASIVAFQKPPRQEAAQVPSVEVQTAHSPLSMSTYRSAANESLDNLDLLLSQQGLRSSGPRIHLRGNPEF